MHKFTKAEKSPPASLYSKAMSLSTKLKHSLLQRCHVVHLMLQWGNPIAHKRMNTLGRIIEKNQDPVLRAWLEIFFTNQCRKIGSIKIKMFLIVYTPLEHHLGENFNFFMRTTGSNYYLLFTALLLHSDNFYQLTLQQLNITTRYQMNFQLRSSWLMTRLIKLPDDITKLLINNLP